MGAQYNLLPELAALERVAFLSLALSQYLNNTSSELRSHRLWMLSLIKNFCFVHSAYCYLSSSLTELALAC